MSLILKGIDLPDKKLMELFESDNHICIGGNYYPLMIKDVIQIPKDHGRLIDADKFIDDLKYDADMDMTRFITDGDEEARYDAECKENCISFIESSATPTILEAEE